jgi:4-hydroxy-L-threonine phosphate dehydrogenase PdxA
MDIRTPDAKPVIALAMGDPAGISPELTVKAVALDEVHGRARLRECEPPAPKPM